MEIAKISSKGQITIPVSVRNRLHLNTGDKVLILEENGRFYIENAANVAFQHVEEGFRGAAAEAGFKSEDEMQDYMKEIREELKSKGHVSIPLPTRKFWFIFTRSTNRILLTVNGFLLCPTGSKHNRLILARDHFRN